MENERREKANAPVKLKKIHLATNLPAGDTFANNHQSSILSKGSGLSKNGTSEKIFEGGPVSNLNLLAVLSNIHRRKCGNVFSI